MHVEPGAIVHFADGESFGVLDDYEDLAVALDTASTDERIALTTFDDVDGERIPVKMQAPAGSIVRLTETSADLHAARRRAAAATNGVGELHPQP